MKKQLESLPESLPSNKEEIDKEESKSLKPYVVMELPTQQVKMAVISGEKKELILIQDAITEILEKIRRIEKTIG